MGLLLQKISILRKRGTEIEGETLDNWPVTMQYIFLDVVFEGTFFKNFLPNVSKRKNFITSFNHETRVSIS